MFSDRAHKSLGELRRRDWIGVPDFHDGAMGRVARARVQRAHRRRGTEGSNLSPSSGESANPRSRSVVSWCAASPKTPVIATSPAYHDRPLQRLLQNSPDTTWVGAGSRPTGLRTGGPY